MGQHENEAFPNTPRGSAVPASPARPPARQEPRTRCRQVVGLTVNTISTDTRLSFRACKASVEVKYVHNL